MISVVIPLYNKEKQIATTLQSVLDQTYQDFEIVIVNDGSTDNSVEDVKKIIDPRIRIIEQPNSGVSAARNRGIEEARGEFVALLDGDDEWKPDYLATQMELVKEFPQCDVFATNYEFRDQYGNVSDTIIRNLPFSSERGILINYFEVATVSHPPICSISIMARKRCFKEIGGFPIGVRLGEDLITWAKLACRYKIAYCTKPKAVYVFASQAGRVIPKKQPNKIDVVGEEFRQLVEIYEIPFLKNVAAKWHKMRMVTFIQLKMSGEARREYNKIRSYINPTIKDTAWYILSFFPISLVQLLLKSKSGFK